MPSTAFWAISGIAKIVQTSWVRAAHASGSLATYQNRSWRYGLHSANIIQYYKKDSILPITRDWCLLRSARAQQRQAKWIKSAISSHVICTLMLSDLTYPLSIPLCLAAAHFNDKASHFREQVSTYKYTGTSLVNINQPQADIDLLRKMIRYCWRKSRETPSRRAYGEQLSSSGWWE